MAGRRARYLVIVLRRIWRFLAVYAGVFVLAALGFYALDGQRYSLSDSFYWSIVTLGTVGYGDIVPTTPAAKILAGAVIATQIFLLGYLFSTIASIVGEESQRRALGTLGTDMKGHIVVLGYSSVGRAAVRELLVQDQTVAVVTEEAKDVENIRALAPEDRLFVTYGPPADRDILARVDVADAHSVIVCTADDATNLIASLNVRAAAPKIRIVVSVSRPELRDTLRAAGVTYVASPADMGGRLCASAAFEPDVANALEEITAADVRSDIQEYMLTAQTPVSNQTVGEAEVLIRRSTGCLLIGCARANGSGEFATLVNPPPDHRLAPGDAVIVIGTIENSRKFHRWFGVGQGR